MSLQAQFDREGDAECAASAQRALHLYLAAERLNELLDDGQAEARAA